MLHLSWTPVYCFAILTIIFVVSEYLSDKTKGYVSFLVFATVFFAIGYWTNILPKDLVQQTGITGILGILFVPLVVVNLGTIIDLNNLLKEWRTVIISLAGLIGVAIACFTIGTAVFGKVYAYSATPPIAGGIVAAIIVSDAANAFHRPEIAAFAMILIGVHNMIGIPLATVCLKSDLKKKFLKGDFSSHAVTAASSEEKKSFHIPDVKVFKDVPKHLDTPTMNLAKLGIVAAIALFVANLTIIPGSKPINYILAPTIAYLIFGLIFTKVNFLSKQSLGKAGSLGIMMLGLMTYAPTSFAQLSPAKFVDMIVPIIGLPVISLIGIAIFSILAGKFLKYSPAVSLAIGATGLLGYPNTQLVAEGAVSSMDATADEKERALAYVLPKMIVGGFVSVTIASVILASIVAPIIFR